MSMISALSGAPTPSLAVPPRHLADTASVGIEVSASHNPTSTLQARIQPGVFRNMLMDPASMQLSQGHAKGGNPQIAELSEAEANQVEELKARDAEVRRHEEAHARAAGPYGGSPNYQYQSGPDGRQYAIGGSVPIDSAPVAGDPAATIQKMQTIKRAASAPAEPSGQDRSIAAQADAHIQQARAELAKQRSSDSSELTPGQGDFARSANAYAQTAALFAA